MWPKKYRDYPVDKPLVKQQLEAGKGIVGCEMHDLNGWGNEIHQKPERKPGFFSSFINSLLKRQKGPK